MAKTAKKSLLKSAPKKKAAVRTPRLMDEKYTGPEPKWTGADTWSEEKLTKTWRDGLNYYNYHYTVGDMIKYASQYGTQHLKWTKQDVAAFNEVEDWRTGITAASCCKMLLNGAPLRQETKEFLDKQFVDVLARGHERLAAKKATEGNTVVKLTIQDRMREKLGETVGEIEGWYDDYRDGKEIPDMVTWMREQNVPQQFVNQIAEAFSPRIEELEESIALRKKKNRTDLEDQLVEGYQHITKDKHKVIADFYSRLTAALETYGAVKKAVRKAKVKKPPSKEKMVKKVKYCVQNTELNIVSINPVDILGSTTLWVYNVKTRKMGKYVAAADAGQLGIKGSTIVGYDEKQSVAKTLRKPADQLKQFAASGKIALRTFLEDIKAVPVNLNGRLSADWVLLKSTK
jgi:hypothetical protein